MKMRTKIIIIIFFTWSLLLGINYFFSKSMLDKSYQTIEEKQITIALNNVNDAIDNIIDKNAANLASFSWWDSLYQSAMPNKPAALQQFADTNFTPNILATYGIDIISIYDKEGNLLLGNILNFDRTGFLPLPQNILQLFSPNGPLRFLIFLPNNSNLKKGIIDTQQRIAIIASGNIYNTQGIGPPHAILTFMQYFDNEIWDKLKNTIKYEMTLYSLSTIKLNSDLQKIYPIVLEKGHAKIIVDNENIFLYSLLKDINEKPAAIIKINFPRVAHQVGMSVLNYYTLAFWISGILLIILLYFSIHTMIINRLTKMNRKMTVITKKKKFNLQLPEEGHDELFTTASKINKFLSHKKSEAIFFNDIINLTPSMLIITNKALQITHLNGPAKKNMDIDVSDKSLFSLFPYLKKYEDVFRSALKDKTVKKINQIVHPTLNKIYYFNVAIYHFFNANESSLIICINNISEKINIQQNLVEIDKLASIGTLTTGVAHALTNPVNFISSAALPLSKNMEDIFLILNQYLEITSEVGLDEKLKEINKLKDSLDFAYTTNETSNLIEVILDGANRTAKIIKNLKTFSHFDKNIMTKANINEGIELITNLIEQNLHNRIEIIKNYGNIPPILCFYGKIIQVFLNVLKNAIESIPNKGQIKITTEKVDSMIKVSFSDTGIGITPENLPKIFNPFFTTKPSDGAGVGLFLSYSIIQEHNGTIEAKTIKGHGTEIIITLPIDHI